jgi:hypothetical protein
MNEKGNETGKAMNSIAGKAQMSEVLCSVLTDGKK